MKRTDEFCFLKFKERKMEDKLFDNCIVNLIKEMSAPYTSSQRIREILKDNFSYICKKCTSEE